MAEGLLSTDEIRSALKGPIPSVLVTRGYRIRLLGVLCGLVVLQFLYLLLIAAVGAASVFYLLVVIGSGLQLNLITIVLYVGPPAAGLIAVLFLLKPVVIRPPRPPEPMLLLPEEHPELFTLIEGLCRVLGSPRPSRVQVDLQVNASASLRGWLGFLMGKFNLTIGLPLATGLGVTQFGGVLAHELGHFAQRTGLRSYFLIQSIQGWFARVVYQRDRWDDWLARQRAHRDWRIKGIAHVAQWVVNGSRRYLAFLMKAGNWVSCAFSRQMEFDADRHAAAIVGVDVFEQTSHLLPLLNYGSRLAWEDAGTAWSTKRLPDDIATLAQTRTSLLPKEATEQILKQVLEEATGRWDTHPSATDRIASVRQEEWEGILKIEGPATRLFRDLPSLCREATNYHYEKMLQIPEGSMRVVPVEESLAESIAAREFASATQELFKASPEFCSRWFRLATVEPEKTDGVSGSFQDPPTFDIESFQNALEMNLNHFAALVIVQNGVRITPASFQLDVTDLASIRAQEALSSRNLLDIMDRFRSAARHLSARVADVIERFDRDDLAITVNSTWQASVPKFEPAHLTYRALSQCQDDMLEIRRCLVAMQIVKGNAKLFRPSALDRVLDDLARDVLANMSRIVEQSKDASSVIVFDPDHAPTVGAQLAASMGSSLEEIGLFVSRVDVLAARALGQLAWFTICACPQTGATE